MREEAESAASTYHVALALLGAEAFRLALELWHLLVTRRSPEGVASFTPRALAIITDQRRKARRLAITFTRLDRALRAGATYPDPDNPEPAGVERLNDLRQEFEDAVDEYAPGALIDNVVDDPNPYDEVDDTVTVEPPDGKPYEPYRAEAWLDEGYPEERRSRFEDFPDSITADVDWNDEALSEEIDRLDEHLAALEEAQEAEARALLQLLAEQEYARKLEALEDMEREDRDAAQAEAHAVTGTKVASHAERITQNGGRHTAYVKGHLDPRVIGFVRVHHPEGDVSPCGFCAMLLSRQVFYKTEKSAGGKRMFDEEGYPLHNPDEYHPGCHCSAEEVYSQEDYDASERFALNRELWDLWQSGPGGRHDLNSFRALMRKRRADQESTATTEPQEG